MNHTAHTFTPRKRRNLARWTFNRLRRLDYKIDSFDVSATKTSPFNDFSPQSITHCRDRAHQLACALQCMVGRVDTPEIR